MTAIRSLIGLIVPILVAACDNRAPTPETPRTGAPASAQSGAGSYAAAGKVMGIAGDQVSISHGPVEELGWPAMTMSFRATDPQMLVGLSAGDQIRFEFRKDAGDYALTSVARSR